jgi:hypothetical protein
VIPFARGLGLSSLFELVAVLFEELVVARSGVLEVDSLRFPFIFAFPEAVVSPGFPMVVLKAILWIFVFDVLFLWELLLLLRLLYFLLWQFFIQDLFELGFRKGEFLHSADYLLSLLLRKVFQKFLKPLNSWNFLFGNFYLTGYRLWSFEANFSLLESFLLCF